MDLKFDLVQLDINDDLNVIVGQSHFIKTVEDIYEIIVTTAPHIKFGLAFNEASGPCLIRTEGNDKDLIDLAVKNAEKIGAGHIFVLYIKNGYPINILKSIQNVQEVVNIYAATANPLQIIIAQTDQGRGIMGVVDGYSPKGIENDEDKIKRSNLLRNIIGYKK